MLIFSKHLISRFSLSEEKPILTDNTKYANNNICKIKDITQKYFIVFTQTKQEMCCSSI